MGTAKESVQNAKDNSERDDEEKAKRTYELEEGMAVKGLFSGWGYHGVKYLRLMG
ncbi:MAG: hypothetical protein ABI273_18755 [Lacunisphaera sp.]